MSRILSIDYGDVRVGLAVSDELLITAQGLDTLTINGSIKNMDGTKSEKTEIVDEIVERLEKAINIPVIKWDERLTTVSAYKTMKELNISQKKKNVYADKLAATYILEGYLNSLK